MKYISEINKNLFSGIIIYTIAEPWQWLLTLCDKCYEQKK